MTGTVRSVTGAKALVPYDGSRFEIEMRDGTRLLSSRARSKELRRLVL